MSAWNERRLPLIARLVLGVIFAVMGFNGFFHFIPMPEMPEAAGGFMGALAATGYMMPLIKIVEIVGGLLLLMGRYIPLGIALLAPVIVNIVLFHLFLAPSGLPIALLLLVAEIYLVWSYRDVFRPMLSVTTRPTDSKAPSRRFAYDH